MRRPLLVSGGPAAGKSTCARALAVERPRGVHIDADDVRQLVVTGAVAPWKGPDGEAQLVLGARNVAALGRNFVHAGFDVTIADVVTARSLPVYREELPGCVVVHLRISLRGARERAATRMRHLTGSEFVLLHEIAAVPPEVDLVLDVDGLSKAEQVAALRDAWAALPA